MPKRMLGYFYVIISRHNLPIRQIVIYLGKEELKMSNRIEMRSEGTSISYEYEIIDLKKVEAEKFLESDAPDVYLLGIPGKTQNISDVIRKIIQRLRESKEVEKAVIDIDITKTWLYQEGMQKGIEEGIQKGIQKGRKEGLKEALIFAIRIKFGKISKSINKEIMLIEDVDRLRLLKKEVIRARTLKEFEKKLKSLNHSR